MRRALIATAALLLTFIGVGCGGDLNPSEPKNSDGLDGEITVFAAASLSSAFTEIGVRFKEEHPGIKVVFSFAGTPTLRFQLEQGARADVFASANVEQMEIAEQKGVVAGNASVFARSTLVIITPAANPAMIESPLDLRRDGNKIILANEQVPVGFYTRQILTAMSDETAYGPDFSAAVLANVISLESNVKQVAAKVALGEADAGVVYFTDVTPDLATDLNVIAVPERFNLVVSYPIALVAEGKNESGARAFIDFVLSATGQLILKSYGFLPFE